MTTLAADRDTTDAVPTYLLLTAIHTHGPSWPVVLDQFGVNAIGEAIRRETAAGNLRDGGSLTEQGRQQLIDLRAQHRLES